MILVAIYWYRLLKTKKQFSSIIIRKLDKWILIFIFNSPYCHIHVVVFFPKNAASELVW